MPKSKKENSIPQELIDEVRELWASADRGVYKEVFDFHVIPVVKNAENLAELKDTDVTVVKIAAFLHDVGYIGADFVDHEVRNAEQAGKILSKYGYSQDLILKIQKCILSHSIASKCIETTTESEILRNADAMAHFQCLPYMIAFAVREGKGLRETVIWLSKKLDEEWRFKMTIPEARLLVKDCYEATKRLFANMRQYL